MCNESGNFEYTCCFVLFKTEKVFALKILQKGTTEACSVKTLDQLFPLPMQAKIYRRLDHSFIERSQIVSRTGTKIPHLRPKKEEQAEINIAHYFGTIHKLLTNGFIE